MQLPLALILGALFIFLLAVRVTQLRGRGGSPAAAAAVEAAEAPQDAVDVGELDVRVAKLLQTLEGLRLPSRSVVQGRRRIGTVPSPFVPGAAYKHRVALYNGRRAELGAKDAGRDSLASFASKAVLTATMVTGDGEGNCAVIDGEVYRQGGRVGDFVLEAVLPGRVVIKDPGSGMKAEIEMEASL